MKAIEKYFHVVLFIMLYKVALAFKSVSSLNSECGRQNSSKFAVQSTLILLVLPWQRNYEDIMFIRWDFDVWNIQRKRN